jgi:hypothetical protein
MLSIRWDWQKLVSYGEVLCFVFAWAVGVLLALSAERPENNRVATHRFAAASDSLGVQASR